MARQILDVGVSLVALVVLSPLLLLISLCVRLDSSGPVLFRQVRVGRGGKDFAVLKFRTMRALGGAEIGTFQPGDTSRVTRAGRILRSSKLDELPQLWNVLKGEMALVGPRPEVRRWVEAYPQRWSAVHAVRPGLTDPASLAFWNEESILAAADDPELLYREVILPQKLELHRQYVRTRSLPGDLAILFRTFCRAIGLRRNFLDGGWAEV